MWVYRLDFAQNYKFEPVTLFHSFAAVMRFFYVRTVYTYGVLRTRKLVH